MMPEFLLSSEGLRLTVDQVVREIANFMRADLKRSYKIMIGTDSQRLANNEADFVTAVVVHRVGNGGRYFWRRLDVGKFYTLRDRIIKEVLISLDVAKGMLAEIEKFSSSNEAGELPEFSFEIHADVGVNGPTSPMIQEVVGMIRANNFNAKTKPESCAASSVADKHV